MSSVSSNDDTDDNEEKAEQQQQEEQEDLDAFLTSVESKLRGPFSSLEFARAVHTHALRGGTVVQYLKNLSSVLARTDKVIQSRILIGLLGLETKEIDNRISKQLYRILQQAQTSPTHEQWPRIVAGLVQGIIFVNNNDDDDDPTNETSTEFTRPCRGAEATEHLSTLCEDVCSAVHNALVGDNNDRHNNNDDKNNSNQCPDLNASFVPYHYSLLPPWLVQRLIPELTINNDDNDDDENGKEDTTHPTKAKPKGNIHNRFQNNPHFHVTSHASILHLDEQLERQRAKDELEHQGSLLSSKKNNHEGDDSSNTTKNNRNNAGNTPAGAGATPLLPPGFRPTKLVTTKTSTASSSAATNMFMPKKTNPLVAHRQQPMQQTMLRRKGAAQSLVNKTKMSHLVASGGASAAASSAASSSAAAAADSSVTAPVSSTSTVTAATAAAAARFRAKAASSTTTANIKGTGFSAKVASASILSSSARTHHTNNNNKGKMKMIDISEVAQLEREDVNHPKDASATAMWTSGGATSSTLRMSKKRRIMEAAAAAKKAKLEREEQQQQQPEKTLKPLPSQHLRNTTTTKNSTTAAVASATTSSTTQSQQADDEWKVMLQERSNKLSDEDRERVQQFFQRRYNPTPDQTLVKMKLHEQRITDSTTGQEIKETFYLELDYTNFSSKQSRKVKRY